MEFKEEISIIPPQRRIGRNKGVTLIPFPFSAIILTIHAANGINNPIVIKAAVWNIKGRMKASRIKPQRMILSQYKIIFFNMLLYL